MSRFYLTTAIDFVNSRPHLGTAYEKICADIIARDKRQSGIDTRFLMGNDEHSQNVFKKAVEQGLDPLAYCDRMEDEFRSTWKALDLSFNDFIRTTEPRHKVGVDEMVRRLHAAGDIYEGVYEGYYCVGCEAFKQDKDLVDGHCPLHPTLTPQWIKEKNYFFKLSKYRQPLLDHFAAHPEFLQPDIRRNEILRLLDSGLEDISVSRAGQSWGIPLPFDQGSVVYVWFDALINYASAVGLGADQALFETWWPADLHVIGKDITRFHTVIWPAMLMAAGLPLPRQVFGHGFMTVNGQRMSKSLGTVIDPMDAVDRIKEVQTFKADPLRLYLAKEVSFGGDGDFSWDRYELRYNVDLANNFGNLVSRVSTMVERYLGSRVSPSSSLGVLASVADEACRSYRTAMDALAIQDGAAAAFRIIDATNAFIADTAPWTLAKDPSNRDRLAGVLFDAAEAVRVSATLLRPFMPGATLEVLRRFGAPDEGSLLARERRWVNDGARTIAVGPQIWPRAERREGPQPATLAAPGVPAKTQTGSTMGQKDTTVDAPTPTPPPAPVTAPAEAEKISIDDFMKVELCTAKVLTAERVPKSSRLLKLQVDTGSGERTIVAGLAESYAPEAMVGRTVVIVFNLKPAKLMGIESNGMVLAASPESGKATLVSFEEPPAPGTRVR